MDVELAKVVALFKIKNIEQAPLRDKHGKEWFTFMSSVLKREKIKSDDFVSVVVGIFGVN